MSQLRSAAGTSLIEAVIGVSILATAVVSMAGLVLVAVRTTSVARDRTMAAILAAQKLEQLCLAPDTLPFSPPDAAGSDRPGFFEYLNAAGAVAGTPGNTAGIVYVRRWAVLPLPGAATLRILKVTVATCRRNPPSVPESCGDAMSSVSLVTVRSETP